MNTEHQPQVCGHRGFAGLYPENSILGFVKAVELGVFGLEMDVAVSADHRVIVSHEPWFDRKKCECPEDRDFGNFYTMTAEEIQQVNCGSLPDKRFPDRLLHSEPKPLMHQVLEAAEKAAQYFGKKPPVYFIEMKSDPELEFVYHPEYKFFADLTVKDAKSLVPDDRIVIQSFDIRVLRYIKSSYPEIACSLLSESPGGAALKIEEAGFMPDVFGAHHLLFTREDSDFLKSRNIISAPWTVNKPADMRRMIDIGADIIITDYPDQLSKILQENRLTEPGIL